MKFLFCFDPVLLCRGIKSSVLILTSWKLRKSFLNQEKSEAVTMWDTAFQFHGIQCEQFLFFSDQQNKIGFYSTKTWTSELLSVCSLTRCSKCSKHLRMSLCFLLNMAAIPRTVSLSGCMMKQSWRWNVDQSNPDFTHISDDITRRKDFFCLRLSPDPCMAPMVNLHWLLKCRGFKDPDTPRRTRFADNSG